MKVRGVNLGNWLVLEKWMGASPLSSARSEDDRGLIDEMNPAQLAKALDEHRATYITEHDFTWMEVAGINLVRIPVPYYLFGSPHHAACVKHLDHAFAWAERHHIAVLIDLHTVPFSQNGFDNGGYLGLCAWARDPTRIDFVVDLLEQIARRYAGHPALWGIEALNEPATRAVLWSNLVQHRTRHPERAIHSRAIPRRTLLAFYERVYRRLRPIVGPEAALVFHDQFELRRWNHLLPPSQYGNVAIDTHPYLNFNEQGFKRFDADEYLSKVAEFATQIESAAKYHRILVGEWSIANHSPLKKRLDADDKREFYRTLANAQLDAWDTSLGGCYWSYRVDNPKRPEWDLRTCIREGWIDLHHEAHGQQTARHAASRRRSHGLDGSPGRSTSSPTSKGDRR